MCLQVSALVPSWVLQLLDEGCSEHWVCWDHLVTAAPCWHSRGAITSLQGSEEVESLVSPMQCGQCRGFLCCGTGCAVWHGVVCWLSLLSPSLLCSQPTSTLSCRARFLENLAAAQKEKISSMAKGRLDVLSDATLEHPTALAWERDHGTSDSGMEPSSISRCCQVVCSQLIWVHGVGISVPSVPIPCLYL